MLVLAALLGGAVVGRSTWRVKTNLLCLVLLASTVSLRAPLATPGAADCVRTSVEEALADLAPDASSADVHQAVAGRRSCWQDPLVPLEVTEEPAILRTCVRLHGATSTLWVVCPDRGGPRVRTGLSRSPTWWD